MDTYNIIGFFKGNGIWHQVSAVTPNGALAKYAKIRGCSVHDLTDITMKFRKTE